MAQTPPGPRGVHGGGPDDDAGVTRESVEVPACVASHGLVPVRGGVRGPLSVDVAGEALEHGLTGRAPQSFRPRGGGRGRPDTALQAGLLPVVEGRCLVVAPVQVTRHGLLARRSIPRRRPGGHEPRQRRARELGRHTHLVVETTEHEPVRGRLPKEPPAPRPELAGPPESPDRPIELSGLGRPTLDRLLQPHEVVHRRLEEQRPEAASLDEPSHDLRLGLERTRLPVTRQLAEQHHPGLADGVRDAFRDRARVVLPTGGRRGDDRRDESRNERDQAERDG